MVAKKPPYEPPEIAQIKILVDESVLKICKVFPGDPQGKKGRGCGNKKCKTRLGT
jgi:hypothetical protein